MPPRPFTIVNQRGSAAIVSSAVTVTPENVVFSFPNHAFARAWYQGTIFVDLAQAIPAGTTGTLPVVFETNGVVQAVTKYDGEALTAADIPGTGVFQFWFDRTSNRLQIMTGVI